RKEQFPVRKLTIFLAISTLPMLAWMGRNAYSGGGWTFSSLMEANLTVRAALVKMEMNQIPYDDAMEAVQKESRESMGAHSAGQWDTQYLLIHWKDLLKIMLKGTVKFLSGNSVKVAAWTILKDNYYDPATLPTY